MTISSLSHSSRSQGGEPEERNMPAAAAWVSVGELRDAEGLFSPRELRAMRMWEGLVLSMLQERGVVRVVVHKFSQPPNHQYFNHRCHRYLSASPSVLTISENDAAQNLTTIITPAEPFYYHKACLANASAANVMSCAFATGRSTKQTCL